MQRVLGKCFVVSGKPHRLQRHIVSNYQVRSLCCPLKVSGTRRVAGTQVQSLQTEAEPPINKALRWLRKQTAAAFPIGARMQVSPEQAQFLAWLIKATRSTKALELGVFTGYSALAVALALPPEGKLIACERDPRPLKLAQQAFEKAGVADKITVIEGPALTTLKDLLQQSDGPNTFDFAFIDADKRAYKEYFELCLQLVRPGGVIALDNVLWYGKVADPEITDKSTAALRLLNQQLLHDKRITLSMVPVGDGMALCLKQ